MTIRNMRGEPEISQVLLFDVKIINKCYKVLN
jgi:hypothetical protein